MVEKKIQIRDLRNGDWFWINKIVLEEYGPKIKPIGIAIYNCLAKHVNQEGFCFPSHGYIAKEIGSSVSSVQRGIKSLIKHGLIKKGRRRYYNIYYLLKLERSNRPNSKIGQFERGVGQRDISDRSHRPTNKNKEKELINKKRGAVDNFQNMKSILAESKSIGGVKIKDIGGKQHMWTGKQWVQIES